MKSVLFAFLFSAAMAPVVSAQNNSSGAGAAKPAFSLDAVTTPARQAGNINYLFSLSEQDFNNQSYVFYTDSNATVAHIRIGGNDIRLTGGHNPENIMTYTGKGYTITLTINKQSNDNKGGRNSLKTKAMLVVYKSGGGVVGNKVTGIQINNGQN